MIDKKVDELSYLSTALSVHCSGYNVNMYAVSFIATTVLVTATMK